MSLPELPEPDTHCFDDDTGEDVWSYSADQMRAYALQAVEALRREPMTDEQIDKLKWGPHEGNPITFAEGLRDFARAVEAHHHITAQGGEG